MKRMIQFLTAFFLFTVIFQPLSASAETELAPNAKSAIMLERDTGQILFNKDADQKLPPASMTKIMTLLLIMESIDQGKINLDEKVRASEYAASMGGSQIFLEPGEEMTVRDLLKGIAVVSGNDASVAMAERIAGSEPAFVDKMNQKVKELGLKNTKFQNVTGLPADDHYSTAHDMAMMAKELLKHEEITEFTGIYEDYLRQESDKSFWLVNTNKLVKFYPGVDGLKTGYTKEAKYCLTATAKKDGMRVIAVVMGADSTKARNSDVSALLDYAFNQYSTTALYKKGQQVDSLRLLKADEQSLPVVTGEPISLLTKKGEKPENLSTEIVYHDDLSLPLKKNQVIGQLLVKADGKVISDSDLVAAKGTESAGVFQLMKRSLDNLVDFH